MKSAPIIPIHLIQAGKTGKSFAIFNNPECNRWETADEYLSGEVVHKLAVVTKLRRPDLALNVAALQAAQPPPLGPGEIRIKLGAPWIPTELIRQFTEELLSR